MKRCFILFLCLSLLFNFLFGAAISANDSKTVRVGLYENSPKIFTDERGNASGFWPDIIDYMVSKEGWNIEYVPGTWTEGLTRLERNEIDIMPDVAYTEERSNLYDFSGEPVYVSWSRLYAKEGTDILSILDLKGKTVAVLKGSVNFEGPEGVKELVTEFDIDCTFIEVDSYTRVFEMVESGEVDAGVTNRDFANRHIADYGLIRTPIIFQPASLYFAFPKGSSLTPGLIERIDYYVKELKDDKDSVYYQSLEKWFGVKPVEKPVIPGWILWMLVSIGGLAFLMVAGNFVLRSRVRARTRELTVEIAGRKQSEEKLRSIYGILLTIRKVNQLIVEVDDESQLLQRACDILVDGRNYKMVWIGFTSDGSYDILPVAQAGFEEADLDSVKITWDDTEYGRGHTGTAIRTGRPSVIRDIVNDERYQAWREQALKRGYLSSAALPLVVANKVIGALNVYSGKPDAFDDGELDMLLELSGDISLGIEKIRYREELRRSKDYSRQLKEQLQLQIDRMPCGLITWDTEFRVQSWNPAAEKIFGFTVAEALGKHPYDIIVPKEAQPHVDDIWRRLLAGDTAAHSTNENITKDGRAIICQWSNTPLKDADGTVHGILSMIEDITEHKQAEEERDSYMQKLEATVKELEAFAYTISHDLRGPLHTVRSFAEALTSDLEKELKDRVTEDIRAILTGVDRMERLLKGILHYSRAGRVVEPTEGIPFGDIVREALEQLAAQISSVGAKVSVAVDFPTVSADRVRMVEALANLIQNSLDYRDTSRPLSIEIGHRRSDSEVIFLVRDNGTGIDPAKRERIFDLFQRGVRGSQGMGAGLAIVKRIIEGHGGRIWAEGEPGKGTTMGFTLPPPSHQKQPPASRRLRGDAGRVH